MSIIYGEIRQIAFVVKDIDTAMAYWSETLGVGPFFIKRHISFDNYVYREKAIPSPIISIALANSGNIQIEIIAQHDDVPSIYKEFLDSGNQGLQHVSAWLTCTEFDERKRDLAERGYEMAQECSIASSGVRLAYYSTETGPGGFIYEISDLRDERHYARVLGIKEAAVKWSGSNAVVEVKL